MSKYTTFSWELQCLIFNIKSASYKSGSMFNLRISGEDLFFYIVQILWLWLYYGYCCGQLVFVLYFIYSQDLVLLTLRNQLCIKRKMPPSESIWWWPISESMCECPWIFIFYIEAVNMYTFKRTTIKRFQELSTMECQP